MPKQICVIDGQGGGIGATIIRYMKDAFGESVILLALGTNTMATARMLKAGANRGASGENPICKIVPGADVIVGPVGITWPNSMMGEVTPEIAEAIVTSPAYKLLLPFSQELIEIIGIVKEPLPHMVQTAVEIIKEVIINV